MASNGNGNGLWHKGALGSPWQKEYYADEGRDIAEGTDQQSGPRIGAGALARRVTMEVERAGRRFKRANGGDDD